MLTAVGWWWTRLWWIVLESEELDKHNMVLPSLWVTSCSVEQWCQKAYTLNTQFEHQLLCPLLWSILNMYLHTSQKCWEWWLDDLDNKHDVREAIAIKWMNQYKWPTYYSSQYCINAMKQYNSVAKIQITLYCNMANQSLFTRYCCIIIRMMIDDWCCLFAFNVLIILFITTHDMIYNFSFLQYYFCV